MDKVLKEKRLSLPTPHPDTGQEDVEGLRARSEAFRGRLR